MSENIPDAAIQEEIRHEWQLWQPDFDIIDKATALCLRNTQPPTVVTTLFETGRYRLTATVAEVPMAKSARKISCSQAALTFLSVALARSDSDPELIERSQHFHPAGPADLFVEARTGRAWLIGHDKLQDLELKLRRAHRHMPRVREAMRLEAVAPIAQTPHLPHGITTAG